MQIVMPQAGFTVQKYQRKALKSYYSRMSNSNEKVLVDDHVNAVLQQQGYIIDEDPRSVYDVDKLYQALNKYGPENSTLPVENDFFKSGVSLAYACFSKPSDVEHANVLDFTIEMINHITTNKKASSGLTAYGEPKEVSMVRAYERGRETLSGKKAPEACIAFARTQFNGKTRLVWGYPYSMTAIEGMFARPLIDIFRRGTTPMALFQPTGVTGALLRRSSYRKTYCYSVDMSSFDSSISSRLIDISFDILSTWFDMSGEIITQNGETFPRSEVFSMIRSYFKTCPIVMPNQHIYKGRRHGVPSGSYFTQVIDSIVNVIIAGTLSARFSMRIDKTEIQVLGDDMVFWSDNHVKLDLLAEYASKVFHVKFNVSKSQCVRYSEEPYFLGRNWLSGVPDIAVSEILKRMKYPERFRHYSNQPILREHQVRLMFRAYAATYRSAWMVLLESYFNARTTGFRYTQWTPADVDNHMRLMIDQLSEMSPEIRQQVAELAIPDDFLSGLLRFNLKYGGDVMKHRPIALLFWT